jgi:CyaY protein
MTDAEFQRIAHATLATVEATVDRWLQEDVIDIDPQRTGGLLELSFPGGGKIVINTQPPLHELWLAARGGGHHFKWDGSAWRDTKDGAEFFAVLSRAASEPGGKPLTFRA